jgi:hypothetical protein
VIGALECPQLCGGGLGIRLTEILCKARHGFLYIYAE